MDELIGYTELKNHLLSISNTEHKALLCTIYAGMARVGEIVRGRYNHSPPLAGKDIKLFPDRIELYIRTEKNGNPRKVPIFRNREAWLCDVIENWRRASGEGFLFDYSTSWAEKAFKRWFPDLHSNRGAGDSKHTIHWLRGWRYSHYRRGNVTGRFVDSKVASLLGGWSTSAVPERFYDFTKIDDFMGMLHNE